MSNDLKHLPHDASVAAPTDPMENFVRVETPRFTNAPQIFPIWAGS
jgi:hypothetical protein